MSETKPPIFTVSRLNSRVRILLEQEMGVVWLVGELSNLVLHSSGHWYFSLKDPGAQVRCAMFRGNNRRVAFRPQDGQQVLVQARLSLYEPRGEYQLVIESMRPAGDGLMQMQLEQLKQKLQAEGLFALERKRALPAHPTRIGLITSPTGAAIHDLLTVLKRRAPSLQVILYPAQVQGEQAVEQLIQALRCANRRAECDVLILGRGGGAAEDLWCFNDERLVRAIAQSHLPVVSAVGHESDVTLSDLVADLRAATPSAAAELVSPDQAEQQQRLQRVAQALRRSGSRLILSHRHRLTLLLQRLQHQHPERRLQQQQQHLDELQGRLWQSLQQQLLRRERKLERLSYKVAQHSPQFRLQQAENSLCLLEQRLQQQAEQLIARQQRRHSMLLTRLEAVSPLATLARGYSLTTNQDGQLVRSTTQVTPGERLQLQLAEGKLEVEVAKIITSS
ncbi:MAG: exodeoxyribonuclease VII large subunit [Aeromonadaceae bacterium]